MRRLHGMILAAVLLPLQAGAQDAVIRIEAKRGAAAMAAAERWRQSFDDVVTFDLPGGWTGIALGPMSPEAAAERLTQLKAAGEVPVDSFVTAPGGDHALRAVGLAENTALAAENAPDAGIVTGEAAPEVAGAAPTDEAKAAPAEPAAAARDETASAAPQAVIRLQALQERGEADAALAAWQETLPESSLWQLPNGWFAIAFGPVDEATGAAWLKAFKAADLAPGDAFLSPEEEMGTQVVAGADAELPPPPAAPAEMPPLDDIQRALRWAGHYDGGIDGKSGPKTRAAIAAEITELRASPDPGTAMRALIQRREDWRAGMGLTELRDDTTGLQVVAPTELVTFDRIERALSIYAPKDDSGVAVILFSQPGGQQELQDIAGLVTALGWVPQPKRTIEEGHVLLQGSNDAHLGQAEGWVRDGNAEGYVLIWPASDAENQARVAAEMSDSLTRVASAPNDAVTLGSTTPDADADGAAGQTRATAPLIPTDESN